MESSPHRNSNRQWQISSSGFWRQMGFMFMSQYQLDNNLVATHWVRQPWTKYKLSSTLTGALTHISHQLFSVNSSLERKDKEAKREGQCCTGSGGEVKGPQRGRGGRVVVGQAKILDHVSPSTSLGRMLELRKSARCGQECNCFSVIHMLRKLKKTFSLQTLEQ